MESASMFTLYVYPAIVGAHLTSTLRLSQQDSTIAARAQDTIQCLLAIMLYYCQPSLFSSTLSPHLNQSSPTPELWTTRGDKESILAFAEELRARAPPDTKVWQAVRRYQLVVSKATLIGYIVLCGLTLSVCVTTLAWAEYWIRKNRIMVPSIGSLPAWDEWTMCRIRMRFDDEDQQAVAGSGVVKAAENMKIILKGHN